MRTSYRLPVLLGAVFTGLPLMGGCSSDNHDRDRSRSSRDYPSDYRTSRDYNPDRYDDAREAGSTRRPWRDADGNLHHNPDWKDASDRGRDSNDRDDRSDRR